MTAIATRVPSSLQPRPKAAPTSETTAPSNQGPFPTKAAESSSPPPITRRGISRGVTKADSDKATAAFVRRTLCAHYDDAAGKKDPSSAKPFDELLPPLTSSNEVDLQLYAFVAIIIREFVAPWYSKITSDHDFVDEVVQIIAHCTRALEQRLRSVDLEELLLDEIPLLLETHINTYRTSHQHVHLAPTASDPRTIYHTIHAHPALSPVPCPKLPETAIEQAENETTYRQVLVQNALDILLPPEDRDNTCLRTLVREIIAELILGNVVAGKLSEGWFLMESITKLAELLQRQMSSVHLQKGRNGSAITQSPGGSGRKPQDDRAVGLSVEHHERRQLSDLFWSVLHYAFLAFVAIRFFVGTIATALISRIHHIPTVGSTSPRSAGRPRAKPTQPMISLHVFPLISCALDLSHQKAWLLGTFSLLTTLLLTGPGRLGGLHGPLDRLLRTTLHLPPSPSASLLSSLLRDTRTTLFPHNTLPPPSIPAPRSLTAIKTRCATSLLALLPGWARALYFGTWDERGQTETVERLLDVLDDGYCNRHVVYAIVELVLVRVLPELGMEVEGEGESTKRA
ncbi:MAG: hypothetical protein M1833_005874 [Piccolia ochrophora]|nr:MAG: hypothetical protein M1833_005874 [Piccolia ochrophora]